MSELAVVATLEKCEAEIEKANESCREPFAIIGRQLTIIRDNGLYKERYQTFHDYCIERWEFGKSHAYRLINSAKVIEDLSPAGDSEIDQPKTERQVREVAKSSDSPKVRKQVWDTATTISENPTAAVIRKAATIVTSPGGGESAEIDAAVAQLVKLTGKIEECGKRVQLGIEAKAKVSRAMDGRKKTWEKRINLLAEQVALLTEHVTELASQWEKTKKQVDD